MAREETALSLILGPATVIGACGLVYYEWGFQAAVLAWLVWYTQVFLYNSVYE